ncbi:hypothetical protein [Bradyrhizobium sp. LTSP885]|uniref:hypothetical protein n=1 Tax=Bradyrhizobium sp. LTSP885 TaxID=1619232 RepID=UPI0012E00C12|nr:hypothetical protein [Bradyrhizobium sp. LTSP885]
MSELARINCRATDERFRIPTVTKATTADDAPTDAAIANVCGFPLREDRYNITQTKIMCEMLRESIGSMQQSLKTLESLVAKIDAKNTREKLQQQIKSMEGALSLRLDELSSIDRMLQISLRQTHRR